MLRRLVVVVFAVALLAAAIAASTASAGLSRPGCLPGGGSVACRPPF
jgi:hypothetical protein